MRKVFGIGLGRTGTTSLTYALRRLGCHVRHFPFRALAYDTNGAVVLDMAKVAHFDALTDLPAACFYRELDRTFPEARFILTLRDAESWARSVRKIWLMNRLVALFPSGRQLLRRAYGTSSLRRIEPLKARFEAHNRDVQAYFAERPNDLLVLDVRAPDAWERLCAFLGRPMLGETAFPHYHAGRFTTLRNAYDFLAP